MARLSWNIRSIGFGLGGCGGQSAAPVVNKDAATVNLSEAEMKIKAFENYAGPYIEKAKKEFAWLQEHKTHIADAHSAKSLKRDFADIPDARFDKRCAFVRDYCKMMYEAIEVSETYLRLEKSDSPPEVVRIDEHIADIDHAIKAGGKCFKYGFDDPPKE